MGMNDHIWNGRNDPKVIAWRKKHVAASNIFADWKDHNFYSRILNVKPQSFKEYVNEHKESKDLGELPESEEAIYQMMAELTR